MVHDVRLTFLGSGDAFSSGGRLQACLHLDGGGEPLLLDCGATALAGLKRASIDPTSIGFVALSHLHGDHFAGVPWLILDGQFTRRTQPLLIAGPSGTRERIERTFDALYPGATAIQQAFGIGFVDLAERAACELGPARITSFEVSHSSGALSYAVRIEYGGKVIAYSGDTQWTDALVDVAGGADLFVCECTFYDRKAPGHLDYLTLMSKRSQLECDRLVITHLSEEMLAHAGDLELETAFDGAVITL